MASKQTIAVLGSGWLGLPLSRKRVQQGDEVHLSTTTPVKFKGIIEAGCRPYLIKTEANKLPEGWDEFTHGVDWLVINIPPGLRSDPDKDLVAHFQAIAAHSKDNAYKIIYISSTSVFADTEEHHKVDEDMLAMDTNNSAIKQRSVEQLICHKPGCVVVRASGLIGDGRHPIHTLAGRTNLPNPDAPINLVTRDHVIKCIEQVLDGEFTEAVLHAVQPSALSRKRYYDLAAAERNLQPPTWNHDMPSKGKQVISRYY